MVERDTAKIRKATLPEQKNKKGRIAGEGGFI